MEFPTHITDLALKVISAYSLANLKLAAVESCTGGLVSGALTSIPGSSAVVDRGFITYSNQAKKEMLGVPASLLETQGAVSAEVAEAMAIGTLERSQANVTVSITGIAGPGGESETKPVGLVYFGRAGLLPLVEKRNFKGSRNEIRELAVQRALELFLSALE
ncbi:nicotinamide-nucleotide amidase [Azospirillaceae bacterium]